MEQLADVREQVRQRYAHAATAVSSRDSIPLTAVDHPAAQQEGAESCCSSSCCAGDSGSVSVVEGFGAGLYGAQEQDALPVQAVAASMGCGNPTAGADLAAGERVLDLGSGGGIDVLLSARRVGPSGFVYGLDMTEEMLQLARANATTAGVDNVEFLAGTIEEVPLPDAAVDVVISNCVVNLSPDKPAVFAELARVLAPGGRVGIFDVVAEDHLTPAERGERGSYVGCIGGALSRAEYLHALTRAGLTDATVTFTHEVAPGMHAAAVHARKPAT